jgi:YHS domain-containing protein
MRNKSIALLSILLPLYLFGCNQSATPVGSPKWVQTLVATYEKDPVGNPPQSIWQYEYNGQTVYYVPPQCCDQFSRLYDASGEVICFPGGGIMGRGDGKCADFFQERKNEKLIWRDPRTR